MPTPRFTRSRARPRRGALARAALALGACAFAACQRAENSLTRERDDVGLPGADEIVAPPTPEEQAAFVGPPAPGPTEADARGQNSDDAPPAPTGEALATKPPDPPADGAGGLFRPDGRPSWWLDTPTREGERVTLTSEALAANAGEARSGALVAARAALRRELGAEPVDFIAETYLARPLPPDARGRAQIVGYVRASGQR